MLVLTICLTLMSLIQGGPSYSITGEVRDSDGKPAAGVSIMTEEVPDSTKIRMHTVLSDRDGRFVAKVDGPGKYLLFYRDEEHGYVPQVIPVFRDPNNPPPEVELTAAAPSAQVSMQMSRNGLLTGQAIDAQTQLPIDNLTFVLCLTDRHIPCWRTNKKSADGSFSVPAPLAPFTLMVVAQEFFPWVGLTGNDSTGEISIASGARTELQLLMKRRPEASDRALSEAEKRPGMNLPAPKLISPEDNQVFSIFPRATRLEWSPVEGAASYTVEIDVCDGRNKSRCLNPQPLNLPVNPPTSNISATSYEFMFVGAQPGRWRVWAVDKDSRDGFKSEWRTFVYLH